MIAVTGDLSIEDFSLDGEYGSEGTTIEKLGPNHFRMTLGTAPDNSEWTNKPQFIIKKNAKGNSLYLEIVAPLENGGHFPMTEYNYSWSYDNENWYPIKLETDNREKNAFIFPVFEQDQVYFGHQVPMSYQKMVNLIEGWSDNNYVQIHRLGKSINNREIYRVEISDPEIDNLDKKWGHYFINIHPGEHNSQWRMVGMIEWLLEAEAREYLKNSKYHFVLMMSVDGPANGWYRVNQEGIDMNRSYFPTGSDSEKQAHEAYLCQRDLEEIMKSDNPITALWNMHTWQGIVEPIIFPGPEFGKDDRKWNEFRDILSQNDTDGYIKKLQNGYERNPDNPFGLSTGWNGGPKRQFDITTVLCEGGSTLDTKKKNLISGRTLIKSIVEFYIDLDI